MKPAREHATNNAQTYFITSETWERRALFRNEAWARLFFENLLAHRDEAYLLHEFVLMPDHFHLLITPSAALERAVQLIKGGFSFRVKKELGSNAEIWQRGFADHRVRDAGDYDKHVHYIHLNPVKKGLCQSPAEYKYSSAYPGWKLDPIPQWLKPLADEASGGTTKVVPFQNEHNACGTSEGVPFQNEHNACGTSEGVPFQNDHKDYGTSEGASFQNDHNAYGTSEGASFQNDHKDYGTSEGVPFQNEHNACGTSEGVPFQGTESAVRPQGTESIEQDVLKGRDFSRAANDRQDRGFSR